MNYEDTSQQNLPDVSEYGTNTTSYNVVNVGDKTTEEQPKLEE